MPGCSQIAHDEAERLERLVTKVLELSRIHAGVDRARGASRPTSASSRAARCAGSAISPRRDRVRLAGRRATCSSSRVDPEMIELVLVVLLENALRFAPAGTEVAVVAGPDADGGCEIRVVDHGPGVPAEHREKVFEEFARLDGRARQQRLRARPRDRPCVRRRARRPDRRARRHAGRRRDVRGDAARRPEADAMTERATPTSLTVMVVEDDAPCAPRSPRACTSHGYAVIETGSAEEAIVLAGQRVARSRAPRPHAAGRRRAPGAAPPAVVHRSADRGADRA